MFVDGARKAGLPVCVPDRPEATAQDRQDAWVPYRGRLLNWTVGRHWRSFPSSILGTIPMAAPRETSRSPRTSSPISAHSKDLHRVSRRQFHRGLRRSRTAGRRPPSRSRPRREICSRGQHPVDRRGGFGATAQLIEAATGSHVWSERYDRPVEDLFAVQNDVAQERSPPRSLRYEGAIAEAEAQAAQRGQPRRPIRLRHLPAGRRLDLGSTR